MTKKELEKKIDDFVNSLDDEMAEEWYNTNRELVECIMEWFKDEIGIKRGVPK